MRLFCKTKDGGKASPVDGYFLFEIKPLCSVVLLKFNSGGREAFHTHAFNAYTWFLSGSLREEKYDGSYYEYTRGVLPKHTPRENNHRVVAGRDSWCLSVRGPWTDTWTENTETKKTTLTHGRRVVSETKQTRGN
jgi:quercetin dioxygenase-like cupin family protein